jgi:predicted O-methyltransferase YrrM
MKKTLAKFVMKIPGWLTPQEASFLENAAKQTEKLTGEIVEIGSFCGKSTICLAQSQGKVYAIDPHKGDTGDEKFKPTYTQFMTNLKKAGVDTKVTPLVKTSQAAAKTWKKKIRMLFIDGLHDEHHAKMDFELWSRHVVPGGVIAIHDSFRRWCGSEKVALEKLVNSKDFAIVGVKDSITYGVKGTGTRKQKLTKPFSKIYIKTLVTIEHMRIVLLHFPSVFRKVLS